MATLSIRAYAKHRGVYESAVRKAISAGRITLMPDGQIDPEVADREWDNNTAVKKNDPVSENISGVTYQKSRANKELFEALLKKLEYEERSGKLVELSKIEVDAFTAARVARDKLLAIPDRVAPILVGITDIHELKEVLRKEIITSLQNLTDFLHGGGKS